MFNVGKSRQVGRRVVTREQMFEFGRDGKAWDAVHENSSGVGYWKLKNMVSDG